LVERLLVLIISYKGKNMSYTYETWGMSYSSTFRRLAEEAAARAHRDLENQQLGKHGGADGEILTYSPHAVTAVMHSVLTLEAAIKEIATWSRHGFMGPTPSLPDHFERKMSLVEKWATVPQVFAGRQFDRNSELWQRFTALVKLRNAITHYQWHVDEVPALMNELARRDLVIPGASGIYWFDAVLTNRIARWAVETIELMFVELTRLLGQSGSANWVWPS
jgi:hypothetical protein